MTLARPHRPRLRVLAGAVVVVAVAITGLVGADAAIRGRTPAAARAGAVVEPTAVAAHGRSATIDAASPSEKRSATARSAADRPAAGHPAASSPGSPGSADQGPGPEPAAYPGVRWTTGSMQVGHLRRAWWLATPMGVNHRKLPLLMVLHGRNSTPAIEAKRTGFLRYVGAGDAIAVYPAGWDTSWNAGQCCGRAHAAGIDDLAFLHRLVTELQATPDVAPDDLDLVGFSNGAKMAFDLVCSGTVHPRAMAVAEAVPTTDCSHSPPIPLVQVAGTADPLVPYASVDPTLVAGGVPLRPVLTEVATWAANNGCTASGVTSAADRQVRTWSGCRAPIALLTYPGGVHAWQPDATPYLWQFLRNQDGAIT
jgi:polyhydroxybutyrate depolymerase